MKRYTYFLKLANLSNRDTVVHELENYLFHSNIEHSGTLWLKWHTDNYSGKELLSRLQSTFLIETWLEE
jgi:hypothetical protein